MVPPAHISAPKERTKVKVVIGLGNLENPWGSGGRWCPASGGAGSDFLKKLWVGDG